MTRNNTKTATTEALQADSELNDSEIPDTHIPASDRELPADILEGNDDSAIENALHQFVTALKQEFARERDRERAKIRQVFTEHVRKIEVQARQVVRERVAETRARDQKKIVEREKRINEQFRKLNLLARDIAHQKQELKKSREEFDRKLMESDYIQTELRNIGQQMGKQVDSLGDALLEEEFMEQALPERKYG